MRLAVIALALAGCWHPLPGEVYELPGQAEAARIVWTECYGMQGSPPVTHWVTGDELDCGGSWFTYDGACADGTSTPEGSALAWWPGRPMSETAMAHEYAHQKRMLGGHYVDELHPRDIFGPPAADGSIPSDPAGDCAVCRATAALMEAGL